MPLPIFSELLAASPAPEAPLVLALAGVMGNAPLRAAPYDLPLAGVPRGDMARLAARFFPRLDAAPLLAATPEHCGETDRVDEFDDLVALLLEHRCDGDEAVAWLARAVATAGMAENHLWQDMGLPHRGMLNRVLKEHFPGLHARNTGDMKWKKFFYRQLCERAEVMICKSPSCGVCVDYPQCFGAEDRAAPIRFAPRSEHAPG